jgi:hypothetical protein
VLNTQSNSVSSQATPTSVLFVNMTMRYLSSKPLSLSIHYTRMQHVVSISNVLVSVCLCVCVCKYRHACHTTRHITSERARGQSIFKYLKYKSEREREPVSRIIYLSTSEHCMNKYSEYINNQKV